MPQKAATRALLAGLLVTAGITGVMPRPAYAVSGGESAPNGSYGFASKINLPGRSCSAVLIDPQWLVTSKSCFTGLDPAAGTAIVGRTDLSGTAGHEVRIVGAVPEPNRNLALVRLATRVNDITPARIAGNPAAPGEAVRAAGYGRTTTEWVPDRLHTAPFFVRGVTDTTVDIVGASPTQNGICKGDSGGPLLRESNGNVELLAVHTASSQNGCFGEQPATQGATGTRVDNIDAWLGQTTLDPTATPAPKHAINLTWLPALAQSGTSYQVYGSTSPQVRIDATTLLGTTSATSFVHRALPARQTWHYRIVPVTSAGTRGAPSNEVSATTRVALTSDFNGDGKDDIAKFPRGSNGHALVSVSTGAAFGGNSSWHDFLTFNDDLPVVGDFNGDGRSDVASVQRGAQRAVHVALSNGSRLDGSTKWHDGDPMGNKVPMAGDFNGDGKDDLAMFHREDVGDVLIALSTGSAFGKPTVWHDFFAFRGEVPLVGDFDGDGKDDIATFHRGGTGDVHVALSNGSRFEGSRMWHDHFSINEEVPAVGDFNGDGRDDVVTFQQHAITSTQKTTEARVALSDGTKFGGHTAWHSFFSVKGEIAGAGDFDGDGRDDVVTFQRGAGPNNDDVFVARSSGSAFVGSGMWSNNFAVGTGIPVPGRVL